MLPGHPPDIRLRIEAKQFNHGFIRPENRVSQSESLLGDVLPILSRLSCLSLRSGFHLVTLPLSPDRWSSDDYPSGSFSHLNTGSLEFHQSDQQVLGHLPYPSPPISQFGWMASSRKLWLFQTSSI